MIQNSSHSLLHLFLLLSCLFFLSSCKKKKKTNAPKPEHASEATLAWYREQSVITDPGKYAHLYETLPEDVPELCRIVQGLLLHVFHTHRYDVELTDQRKKEVRLREVEHILQRLVELDERSLIHPRKPGDRVISHCRDYAILLCSFLRHKGIPARAREGFATYFEVLHQCHWICEYWCEDAKAWVIVDAQLDAIQAEHYQIDFDPLDVPAGKFLYAGQEYELVHKHSDPKADDYKDWLYEAKRSLIQDLAALNKVEVEVWDVTDFMEIDGRRNPDAANLLRRVVELTTSPSDRLSEIRDIYKNHSELQIPIN